MTIHERHLNDIIDIIAWSLGSDPISVRERNKSTEAVLARFVVYFILKIDLGLTLNRTARLVGLRDHTSVINGLTKVREQRSIYGWRVDAARDALRAAFGRWPGARHRQHNAAYRRRRRAIQARRGKALQAEPFPAAPAFRFSDEYDPDNDDGRIWKSGADVIGFAVGPAPAPAPAYTFDCDLDNGRYWRPGLDEIRFVAGGVERFRFLSAPVADSAFRFDDSRAVFDTDQAGGFHDPNTPDLFEVNQ